MRTGLPSIRWPDLHKKVGGTRQGSRKPNRKDDMGG